MQMRLVRRVENGVTLLSSPNRKKAGIVSAEEIREESQDAVSGEFVKNAVIVEHNGPQVLTEFLDEACELARLNSLEHEVRGLANVNGHDEREAILLGELLGKSFVLQEDSLRRWLDADQD